MVLRRDLWMVADRTSFCGSIWLDFKADEVAQQSQSTGCGTQNSFYELGRRCGWEESGRHTALESGERLGRSALVEKLNAERKRPVGDDR